MCVKSVVITLFLFIFLSSLISCNKIHFVDNRLYEGCNCQTSDGKLGTCTKPNACPPDRFRLSLEDICLFEGKTPIYCCAEARSNGSYPVIDKMCNLRRDHLEKYYGRTSCFAPGRLSATGAHPHMAAIGWTRANRNIEWNCGGSFIHPRFILTAAHCTDYKGVAPDIARFGVIKLIQSSDYHIEDFRIDNIIVHPSYRKPHVYNDIALLRVQQPQFCEPIHVRPVCLWTARNIPSETVLAMGYGTAAFTGPKTNALYEGNLSLVETLECRNHYTSGDTTPNGLLDSQICAFDPEGKADTCQGDSGGPLQFSLKSKPYLVGITSFGEFCIGTKPGVYTRVYSYLDWIENILQESEPIPSKKPRSFFESACRYRLRIPKWVLQM